LFFVVGFLAELIVSQNERVDDLEARVQDLAAAVGKEPERDA
jgi:hypothetical protein